MKMRVIPCQIASLAITLGLGAVSDARVFEDKFGRTIEAELVSHTGAEADEVTIKVGKKESVVKLAKFSAEDQVYIRNWMKTFKPKINYAFRVEAVKKKLSSTTTPSSSYRGTRSKVQVYTYEVTVTNLSRHPVKDIKIEYHAFMENKRSSAYYYSASPSTISQSATIPVAGPLRYNGAAKFQTAPFKLDSVRSSYYYGSSSRYKDSLLGVLVRVSDPEGNVIENYRTPSTRFKNRWPSTGGASGKPAVIIK